MVRFGLDSAYLYRVPGDDQPAVAPMSTFDGTDPDARRAIDTQRQVVNEEPTPETARNYLSAYAPFYDSRGVFVGMVAVDMWVRTMDQRLAWLQRLMTIGSAAIFVATIGVVVAIFGGLGMFVGLLAPGSVPS